MKHFKVLVVEDNVVNQKIINIMLKKEGNNVFVASNGKEGINFLRNNDIDIILMDIQMPVMDGISAARAIRSGGAGESKKNIPVIAVTAHSVSADRNKCLDAGMNDYMTKPVKPEELKALLMKYL